MARSLLSVFVQKEKLDNGGRGVCVQNCGGGTGMVNVKKFNVSFDLFQREQCGLALR